MYLVSADSLGVLPRQIASLAQLVFTVRSNSHRGHVSGETFLILIRLWLRLVDDRQILRPISIWVMHHRISQKFYRRYGHLAA